MSLQDNIFDIENIFKPTDDDGEPCPYDKAKEHVHIPEDDYQVGQEAWEAFYAWSCVVEERMEKAEAENKTLKDAIKIIQGGK
jgi:hypothetical protein